MSEPQMDDEARKRLENLRAVLAGPGPKGALPPRRDAGAGADHAADSGAHQSHRTRNTALGERAPRWELPLLVPLLPVQ
jgi:hypothetical protein